MEIFLIMLLGGFAAYSWSRIDKLEHRIANLSEQLDRLARRDRTPRVDAGAARAAQPTPATPATPASTPGDEDSPARQDPEKESPQEPPQEPPQEELPAAEIESETQAPEPGPADAPAEYAQEMAYQAARTDADDNVQTSEPAKGFTFDFEDIFGRRLPIWGGGFALAIAGIFLVKFSIEAGLLTPLVRVAMSFVFGLALLIGAEAAFRFEDRLRDPRVRQALAGAGLATLYGAFYLGGTAYGLFAPGVAFFGLAAVTAAAIALSFRFGLPSAIIGLVGGFAAPLLVNSDSANVPLLSFYLALITGGLAWSGQAQGRKWLSYAALAAGLGWGALMMFAGVSSTSDFAALGIYLIILGSVLPALLYSSDGPALPKLAAGAIAALQMAVLVSEAGFAPLTWGLYLLIGAALSGLGWRYPPLRLGALIGAGLGLWLTLIWPDPGAQFFALIAAAMALIFAGVPLAHLVLDRAKTLDIAQLSAVALVLGVVCCVQFGIFNDAPDQQIIAAGLAGLALFPIAAFILIWRRFAEGQTRRALPPLASGWLLIFGALLLVTPDWLAPVMAVIATAPVLWCHWRRGSTAISISSWAGAGIAVLALTVTPDFLNEFARLGQPAEPVDTVKAALRWAALALPFLCIAYAGRSAPTRAPTRAMAQILAVCLIYGVIAQLLPPAPLAWIAAIGAIGMILWQDARSAQPAPEYGITAGAVTAMVISSLWAAEPFVAWIRAGVAAASMGEPFFASSSMGPMDIALRVMPIAAVLGTAIWKTDDLRVHVKPALPIVLGILIAAAIHSLYKLVFGISSLFEFEHYGMAERTIWQAGLLLCAFGVWQAPIKSLRRPFGFGLLALGLMHFMIFTLFWHNPLWAAQHVGPTPIANWLPLAYLTAIAALWFGLARWNDVADELGGYDVPAVIRPAIASATMALTALLALSLLRQIFAGSILISVGIDQTESLLISLLGIVLALGFLWWGSWRGERSWRIGSLVLMLAAVIKVFLIDAAALEGLLRIASFMALGFSLIGIGWVYSRQLTQRTGSTAEAEAGEGV